LKSKNKAAGSRSTVGLRDVQNFENSRQKAKGKSMAGAKPGQLYRHKKAESEVIGRKGKNRMAKRPNSKLGSAS